MEIKENNHISFLDVMVIVRTERFYSIIIRSLFVLKYLNFNSNHPLCHKRGVVTDLLDKMIKLTDTVS